MQLLLQLKQDSKEQYHFELNAPLDEEASIWRKLSQSEALVLSRYKCTV